MGKGGWVDGLSFRSRVPGEKSVPLLQAMNDCHFGPGYRERNLLPVACTDFMSLLLQMTSNPPASPGADQKVMKIKNTLTI
jgi:hypothetical protein